MGIFKEVDLFYSFQPITLKWAGSQRPAHLTTKSLPCSHMPWSYHEYCKVHLRGNSLQQLIFECYLFYIIFSYLRPPDPQTKAPGYFHCGGSWSLCEKRQRIIPRLQLIFSPRFSSGKKAARPATAVFDIDWMVLTSLTFRANWTYSNRKQGHPPH